MATSYLDYSGLNYFFQKLGLIFDTKLNFKSMTTAQWATQTQLVSQPNTIYIYTDHHTKSDGNGGTIDIAGFKLGDGQAYVIDLPFLNVDEEAFNEHVNNALVHITNSERTSWNNKCSCFIDNNNTETLVFTTD